MTIVAGKDGARAHAAVLPGHSHGLAVLLRRSRHRLRGAAPPPLQQQPQPPAVNGFPIGWCIRAKPEAFADAKSAGFEYVELALQDVHSIPDADFQKLKQQLDSSGVRALSGYNPIPKELKIVGPDVDRAKLDGVIGLASPPRD